MAPFEKGESPIYPKIIYIEKGRKEYKLNISLFKKYQLEDGEYWMSLTYKNSKKNFEDKILLRGEYKIPSIPFKVCTK